MIKYIDFDKRYSVLTPERLKNPKLFGLKNFELPIGALVHYIPKDSVEIGIDSKDLVLNGIDDDILVRHVEDLVSKEGNPKEQKANIRKMTRDYHKRFRRLRPLRRLDTALNDKRTVVVNNYAMLQHIWIYRRTALSSFHAWENLQNTFWSEIKELSGISDREHFLELGIPRHVPSSDKFKIAEKTISKNVIDEFKTPLAFSLLEIYLWLADAESLSTEIKDLDNNSLGKLNLVFMESGQWCNLSFSKLLAWKEKLGPERAKMDFLKFIEFVFNVRTASVVDEADVDDTDPLPEQTVNPNADERTKKVMDGAISLAENGMLTAKELKRMEKLSNKFKEIPSPSGEGKLEDLLKIDTSALNGLEEATYRDRDTVFDKTTLRSTVKDFDKKYVEEFLEKDVANVVMAIQSAGLAVADYKKETVRDVANHYDVYTVKVVPVSGEPSTIRFRIPVVDEFGRYLVNGTKSLMGKQRGDVPIRKTSPTRVALTSYYGKNFVDRSEKVASNQTVWLSRKLVEAEEASIVSDVVRGNVLNTQVFLPTIYTGLSKNFSAFKVGDLSLNFDYEKRSELFGDDNLKKLEKHMTVVCGSGRGGLITIDDTETFYLNKNGSVEELGSISDLLGIEVQPPAEFATVTIFGKSIPIAIPLIYKLGIDQLVKTLKVKYRIVSKGTRVELSESEFAVVFKDETLVLSKENKVATLIFASLNDYKRQIKMFDLNDFNSKDVVFSVLSKNQLGVRYAREIELLFDMFIDHITLEILDRMGEPKEFGKLLIRAVELLAVDKHPDETDLRFMRIKGYERFPGFLYRQLVDSVRKYRQSPSGRGKLEMNPQAVWMDILKDQSVALVEESNPIHSLKENELVTYGGQGGRSAQSMVKSSRVFHKTDLGVISEGSVDSSKVAINTYLSANPNFDSLRGTNRAFDETKDGAASVVSTSALLHPVSDKDE